ncbi:hypothetical protein ACWEV0_35905, partial [Streptomyces sp. NPDC003943]
MAKDFDLYRLSEEHEMLRETVRSLAEAKITPFAAAEPLDGPRGRRRLARPVRHRDAGLDRAHLLL